MPPVKSKDAGRPVGLFLFLTALMTACSAAAIQKWPTPWNFVFFSGVYIIVAVLIYSFKGRAGQRFISYRWAAVVSFLLVLAGLNVAFSATPFGSLKSMVLFFITGPLIWWVSNQLFVDENSRKKLFKFFTLLLFLGFFYGLWELFTYKRLYLFNNNSIAAGSVILLLMVGPLVWCLKSETTRRWIPLSALGLGMTLIVLAGKRGALLGCIIMIAALALVLWSRRSVYIIIGLISLVFIGYQQRDRLPRDINRHFLNSISSQQRLENYSYAYYLFWEKPFIGYGLHAPIHGYLAGYRAKHEQANYGQYINELRGFDNIFVTGFVMVGSLFTLTYMAMTFAFIYRFLHPHRSWSKTPFLILLPLLAFLIQSLTYDSLLFPQVNWLFHAALGGLNGGFENGSFKPE